MSVVLLRRFDDLPSDEQVRIINRTDEYGEALRAGRPIDPLPWLEGFVGDARFVLLHELTTDLRAFQRDQHQRESDAQIADIFQIVFPGHDSPVKAVVPEGGVDRNADGMPQIDGFEFEKQLGEGGFARVYLAWQRRLARNVALKVPKGEDLNPDDIVRFLNEGRLQGQLEGAGVPALHDIVYFPRPDNRPCLVMEYVDGERLHERLGPHTPGDAALIREVAQICQTLAITHPRNILHLDLQPKNVYRSRATGEVKILDWGLGLRRGEMELPDEIEFGTANYASPEQLSGRIAELSYRSDMFAVGCILVTVLTGRPLFPDTDDETARKRCREGDFAEVFNRLRDLPAPAPIIQLALECLRADPEAEVPTAAEAAKRIDGYFDRLEQENVRRRTRMWWMRSVMAVLIVSMGLIGWFGIHSARMAHDRGVAQFEQRLQTGNVEAQAGRWMDAHRSFTEAISDPFATDAQRLEVRLKLLRANTFLGDFAATRVEIASLRAEGVDSPVLDFEEGITYLQSSMLKGVKSYEAVGSDINEPEMKAIALFEKSLNSPALSVADRETALGILAKTGPEALRHYRNALDLEPQHAYAGPYLLSTLTIAGRLEDALTRAEVWCDATPNDPLPWSNRAFLLTIMNRPAEAKQALARLHVTGADRPNSEGLIRDSIVAVRFTAMLVEALPEIAADPSAAARVQLALIQTVMANRDEPPSIFPVPLSPAQRVSLGRCLRGVMLGMMNGQHEEGIRLLEKDSGFVAAGLVTYIEAILTLESLAKKQGKPKLKDQGRVCELLKKAAEEPRVFDVRAICYVAIASYSITASRLPMFKESEAELVADGRLALFRAALLPNLTPLLRTRLIEIAGEYGDDVQIAIIQMLDTLTEKKG